MTEPRQHIPGQTVLLTRRCVMRFFFLRPDESINHIMRYEVAKAADRYDQQIHGAVAMSNHVHLLATDTTGDRSDFMRDAMSGIARARNHSLNRKGTFWGSGQFGDTVTVDHEAMERKLLYTWLNPVRAGLVERVEDWPGFMILPKHWGKTIEVEVPGRYYGRNSPKTVTFTPQPPPGFQDWDLEDAREHFQELIRREEKKIHNNHPDRTYKGVNGVCGTNPFDRPGPAPPEPSASAKFATTDAKMMDWAQRHRAQFLDDYETMRQRWAKGRNDVTFPAGTVQLSKLPSVTCQSPDEHAPGVLTTSG